ncbi:MAG TPA: hypothetical protein DDW65_14630 [Firmicutes bacterium]|jgi:beta-galactosidase|nr:hypothetical protein [Bacillota bacterium]
MIQSLKEVKMVDSGFTISLAGKWHFALDPQNIGEKNQWFHRALDGEIVLPGSVEENGYGDKVNIPDMLRLNRQYRYIGLAWYQRDVEISKDWNAKYITLFLERCLWETRVWINDQFVGRRDSLSTPHEYDLNRFVTPGRCRITICVDNTEKYRIGTWGHSYSDDMQTIWNGIIGRIELRVQEEVFLQDIQVYPFPTAKKARVAVKIGNTLGSIEEICLSARVWAVGKEAPALTQSIHYKLFNEMEPIEFEIPMEDESWLWDEFNPNMYQIQVKLHANSEQGCHEDEKTVAFGMRNFDIEGSRFLLNGLPVFFRGTLDCGSFPITGYPAMDIESWRRIYRIGKDYGLNHFRYHSWCPPEAAFIAADELGIFLQVELPFFPLTNNPSEVIFSPHDCVPPLGSDPEREQFFQEELERILDEYGNHPSFVLMCMGNELKGDYDFLAGMVEHGKQKDGRHLYTSCSNNSVDPSVEIRPYPGDQYYVAHAALIDNVRSDRRCENRFNVERPETMSDYRQQQEGIDMPILSHEVGQWMVYPNFEEMKKYTGVLKPVNFQFFKESLESKDMGEQAKDFVNASGKLAALLYREEIERSLRTPNYGGFQLLDIHDYHGQGSSTIGMLDAFWDSKGLIGAEEFRNFCGPVVILVRMQQRVWSNRETLLAEISIANYGNRTLTDETIVWRILDSNRHPLNHGKLPKIVAPRGQLTIAGNISVALSPILKAEKLILELGLESLKISNCNEFWVYPDNLQVDIPPEIKISGRLDQEAEAHLAKGGKILLLPETDQEMEAIGFTTVFWNTQLFKNQKKSMGIFCDPHHPALADFPTDYHTNWQWWDLLHDAKAAVLNDTPIDFRPIVQVIDHPLRNNKEGILFEAKKGQGTLLVCTVPLTKKADKNFVARQLLYSLITYMNNSGFAPEKELPANIWANFQ